MSVLMGRLAFQIYVPCWGVLAVFGFTKPGMKKSSYYENEPIWKNNNKKKDDWREIAQKTFMCLLDETILLQGSIDSWAGAFPLPIYSLFFSASQVKNERSVSYNSSFNASYFLNGLHETKLYLVFQTNFRPVLLYPSVSPKKTICCCSTIVKAKCFVIYPRFIVTFLFHILLCCFRGLWRFSHCEVLCLPFLLIFLSFSFWLPLINTLGGSEIIAKFLVDAQKLNTVRSANTSLGFK